MFAQHRWRELPRPPTARAAAGAAIVGGRLYVVTIASVYGFDLARGRWQQLAGLPTPRHGLGVAAVGGTVYAIGGGTQPGLSVSDANESLALG